ncbi:MAG TPA: ornithine carbamoyltransferase [Candidatus Eisenbacteria bacterium]|nr:ornithine carbamoyltransferase [Candidatus Eisenbacteria bacterium]
MTAVRHLLTLRELSAGELIALLDDAVEVKREPAAHAADCERMGLLLLMQKTSTRTVLSFSAAISQMGGYAVTLDWRSSNFAISPIRHEVRYASRNCDVILARCLRFEDVAEMAAYSLVPVINGCCNRHHPSQALADLMTVREVAGRFDGVTVAYVGVHNNVANSLIVGCTRVGVQLLLVTPSVNAEAWDEELMAEARATGLVSWCDSLPEAAARADFLYTDTWVDMEHFGDAGAREDMLRRMAPYRVSSENLHGAQPFLMHDMPIHPGMEIDDELVDSPRSVIFQQSENRLHVAKALLRRLLARPR